VTNTILRDTVDVSADDVSSGSENAGAVWREGDAPGREDELEMSFESFHGPVIGVEVWMLESGLKVN
jgi:hypothetical protein